MRLSKIIWILLIITALISCNSRNGNNSNLDKGDSAIGKVVSIIDGDTYDLLIDGKEKVRIRMEGIDAPEKGMPFYKVSKKYLSALCFKKDVKIEITGKDRYKRLLAYTYMEDGTELSHEMIRAGLAWHYKQYNSNRELSELENEAKAMKRGLWIEDNPMAPWANRKLHREGISTKDSFNIKMGQE